MEKKTKGRGVMFWRSWYGFQSRLSALWHLARGHRIRWRTDANWWLGCSGNIECEDCPDAGSSDLVIWCRYAPWRAWIAERICGWLGHPGWEHPQRHRVGGADDECDDVMDEWWCTRCVARRHDEEGGT